jgi:hypothetical protein
MSDEPTVQPTITPPATQPEPTQPEPTGERITLTTSQLEERLREQENRTLARLRSEQEQKDRKAELAQLAAKAEWEEIAKTHEQTVRELQPQLDSYKTRLETLSDRLNKQIEQGIRDWPAEARKMVPPSEDVAARLDAYENMRQLLDGGRVSGRAPGNGTGPRPTAGPAAAEKTEELLRSNPRYSAL